MTDIVTHKIFEELLEDEEEYKKLSANI